jgi:hypothetical protein
VRIVCPEWKLDSLLSELAVHRLDLVLADSPIPQSVDVRAYNHRLGESSLTFFASRALAERCRDPFPECLDAMPMLLPGEDSALRSKLVRWLSQHKLRPTFAGGRRRILCDLGRAPPHPPVRAGYHAVGARSHLQGRPSRLASAAPEVEIEALDRGLLLRFAVALEAQLDVRRGERERRDS